MARDDCNPHSHPLDSGSTRLLYIAMHADVCVRTLQCDGAIMAQKQAKHTKQQSRSLAETSLLKYETLAHRHLIYSRAPMIWWCWYHDPSRNGGRERGTNTNSVVPAESVASCKPPHLC